MGGPRLRIDERLLDESAEELYEHAPCGYLSTDPTGLIVKVNETFLSWTGYTRGELVGRRRFPDLLNPGGRIYYETHYAPLLAMQQAVREIAIEVRRADGSTLPALVNAVLHTDDQGDPQVIRTTVFDATDRRRYEQELLTARRQEQQIAQELQRSLLSGALPVDVRLGLGVQYRAGGVGLEVGGDWYDAFWVDEHSTVALVVGDVVGRGIAAAATMGQLRSAVRALAASGIGPGALLRALDRFSQRHDVGLNTTLVYAELNLAQGALVWACAGHPPPVLVEAGADPRLLMDGRSAPIDAYIGDVRPLLEGHATLAAGDVILFYTDGLVERRGASIDRGIELLLEAARLETGEDAPRMARRVFESLRDTEHSDDTCVVAAQLCPPR